MGVPGTGTGWKTRAGTAARRLTGAGRRLLTGERRAAAARALRAGPVSEALRTAAGTAVRALRAAAGAAVRGARSGAGADRSGGRLPAAVLAVRAAAAGAVRRRPELPVIVVAAVTGLAVALAAVAAGGPWQDGQRRAERLRAAGRMPGARPAAGPAHRHPAPPAPAVLTGLGPGTTGDALSGVPLPTAGGLDDALAPLFQDPALGPVRTGVVLDAVTGRRLYGRDEGTPSAPASTTKIATAVAALVSRGPEHRIPTVVVRGTAPGTIVLVGGGDPTLTAAPPPAHGDPDTTPASLRTLAAETARSLLAAGTREVALTYDTSRFTGPRIHPIGVNDNIAPVTALMADEGRIDPRSTEDAPRYADPAGSAADAFAGFLRARGVRVGSVRPGRAPGGGRRIAEVESMPLSALVERMLTNSDNDIAEALGRQAAIGTGHPVSFAGAGQAIRSVLARLRLPLAGTAFHDGSGLDRADRLTPDLLAHLLLTAAQPGHPELRAVLSGLPVAGFTGTLADRFRGSEDTTTRAGGHSSGAAGLVRAKTGTLTGVNTLAGTVVDADGRLLVFAFMTSGTTNPTAAVGALDRLASGVTNCGCR